MNIALRKPIDSAELIPLETLTPSTVFAPGGVDQILERIEREVRSFVPDISTESGRKAIASLAYRVARSKTALDDMGKDLVADLKKQTGAIDGERRTIRDRLDALKEEVRKPLTDWENAEKDRIAGHEAEINRIGLLTMFASEPTSEQLRSLLAEIESIPARDWQEFAKRASDAINGARESLMKRLEAAEKREAEAAELARLRAEQAAREQKERDDRIAAEAAERARAEAEAKAKREAEEAAAIAEAERKRVELEKAEAVLRAEKAEAERKAAAQKAEREAREAAAEAERNRLAAIEAERRRAAEAKAAEEAAAAKREANQRHAAKINNEVLVGLTGCGVAAEIGKVIIASIVRGEIPHIKIIY